MANSSIFYKDNESDYESSTVGPDSSRRTSWLSSSFTASPSCSSISHLSNHGLNSYNQSKPHKANQVAWEAMARLRRCCGRAVGLEHFRLLKRLGSGDIGSVYLCQIRGSPETAFYAMKVVDKEAVAVKKKLGRAEMEKKILGMLDHPFCPTLYAAFEASHYSFLVMEYCPGGDLYAVRLRQPSKRFTISSTRFYAAETLVALEYLHMMGIVYRDLKPENVLIREDGHVMLSDFDLSFKCDVVPQFLSDNDRDRGHQEDDDDISIRRKCSTPSCTTTPLNPVISCFSPTSSRRRKKNVVTTTIHENAAGTSDSVKSNDVSRTFSRSPSSCSRVSNGLRDISGGCPSIFAEPINARSKSFVGTHEYLAPEVISGQGHGSAVDWWTYGIFLYEMIFGRTPFKGDNNEKTLVNILKAPLTFPKVIVNSPKEYEDMVNAQDLIIKLLVKNPKKRLGSLKGSIEIKRHEFFEGVNWALIRSIKPPWVPKEETSHKTKGDNRSVNYYLPPRFMMSRKERNESHLTHKREIEREKGSAFYIIYDYTLSNMAASVDNRQYARLEPGLNGVVRSYKPPVPGRSDSPKAHQNQTTNQTVFLKPAKVHDDDEDVSSEDENETHNSNAVYYKEMIRKSNAELEPSVLDPRDEYTADSWIERNPSMVRLTGKHPFNSEAPLNRLMHHGFITPVPLHYVRNHGHVPKAQWAEWTVEVTGFVKRPMKFTMDQLVSEFAYREFAATLVCAGNRRKEQNMVKKSKGFNWGSAGVSTSVWRGVPLCDVLRRCGIFSRKGGALNVCFEGSEDLPGGAGTAGSKYGTSIKKEYAMDPSRDIILAYMQNGEYLTPDHGFPVRIIIPGFIGGRMVKWLKRIIVTTKESDNFYHFKDNRVLPSLVDAELADEEGWWYKPEYIINELNINSVITTPCHEEILPINAFTTQRPYTLKGYAYSGGGKKVTRVEVTVDGGETWNVCALDHQEKPNKYGKFWCWCFWSLEVEVLDLLSAKEIAVRAWDETLNTQPEKMIWNLMGMMNNCWFRVKTNVCKPHKGEIGIVFEHPTLPGNESGGWMAKERHLEKSADAPPSLKKSVSTPFMNTTAKMYSMSEVKKHNSADSCWIIVHGHIYDCTRFLMDHPGGSDSILINAGTDCTEEFEAIHSDKAKKMLEDYRIGELITTGYSSDSSSPNNSVHGSSAVFSLLAPIGEATPVRNLALVNPRAKVPVQLVEKTSISHDVRKFRFALPVEDMVLGLPVGKHIFLCATINDKLCLRAYTPSSTVDVVGYFELVVKIYFGGVHPRFPNGGLMSQYLDSLPIGSTLEIKGPLGHVEYLGKGSFTVHGKPKFADKLAMLAGGTGITPVYQIIQAILKDPEDETEMYVIYANRTEEDILLREELDGWAEQYPDRLKVWYVVESAKEGWAYSTGFISEAIMREHIPDGLDGSALAMACGPPPMIQFAVQPNLEKMQYNIKEDFLIF